MQIRPDRVPGQAPPHPAQGVREAGAPHALARPLPQRVSASLIGAMLIALMLAFVLAGCGPVSTADSQEAAGSPRPTQQTSADPEETPTAEEPAPGEAPAEETSETAPAPVPETDPGSADGTALAMLAELEEKGRAPKTGYDRDSFGWRDDLDRNGCDTRIISSSPVP